MNERVWSVATWSAPIVIQLVFGAILITMWLLGKAGLHSDTRDDERTTLLLAMGISVVISLAIASVLWRRTSSTARGIGLGAVASAVIVLVGGSVYAFWPL